MGSVRNRGRAGAGFRARACAVDEDIGARGGFQADAELGAGGGRRE